MSLLRAIRGEAASWSLWSEDPVSTASGSLAYKRNLDETLGRLRALWTRRMSHGICASMHGWHNPHLDAWTEKWRPPEQGVERDLPSKEEIFERHDAAMRGRAEVEDDSLPVAYGCLDWGESGFAAFLGARTHFYSRGEQGGTYAWAEPLIDDWAKLPTLRLSEDSPYYARFLDTLRYLVERADGLFGINAFLRIDALTHAMELRGATQALLDIYEHRRELEEFCAFSRDLNAEVLRQEYEIIPEFRGGRFTWIGGWLPHPAPVPLSVDPYVYCGSQAYRDLGYEYQRQLVARFGAGFTHVHDYRLDLLAMICEMPGMVFAQGVESGGGLGTSAFAHLGEIKRVAGDTPLLISCSYGQLLDGMRKHALPGGVLYSVSEVPGIYEANKAMEQVRSYEAPPVDEPNAVRAGR